MGLTADPGLKNIWNDIKAAAESAGRDPTSVKLIAISKTHKEDKIRTIIKQGQKRFGENRIQEAKAKWPALKAEYPDIELHLVGPIQSNKVKDAVRLFDVIHTVDRPKVARALAEEIAKANRHPKLFIQVNTGEEPQKSGISPQDVDHFARQCKNDFGLSIEGLMCIPPIDEEPSLHFALLEKCANRLGLAELSMGMSADFKTAIQFGATYIRIGTAIFGERQTYP